MQLIEPKWPAPASVLAVATTRVGGRSCGVYEGLNLALHVGDDASKVACNRQLLAAELPPGSAIQWLSQVHGSGVIPANVGLECPEADACWASEPQRACAVLTADCLPVLFCNTAGTVVAAAHAGWRGLCGGILEATIAAMPVIPDDLMAWMGPGIGGSAFEVGPEVRAEFLAAASAESRADVAACFSVHRADATRYLADLYGLAKARLVAAGVGAVYGGEFCTFSDPSRFYSYRRDGNTGRMATLICVKAP